MMMTRVRRGAFTLILLAAAGCTVASETDDGNPGEAGEGERFGQTTEALSGPGVGVSPPGFSITSHGFYCTAMYPGGGWTLGWSEPGDMNTNRCGDLSNANFTHTGIYSNVDWNIVEARCAKGYWIEQAWGKAAFEKIWSDVTSTPNNGGSCRFDVVVGGAMRAPPIHDYPTAAQPISPHVNMPGPSSYYQFDPQVFGADLVSQLKAGSPAPVGFQIAVRDPNGNLVYSTAQGSVTGSSGLDPKPMTASRRLDLASMSKTLTAAALVAAIEDLQNRPAGQPSLGIGLDSSIRPYLPSNWKVPASVNDISFRMLLRHRAGFCASAPKGDDYASVQANVEAGPAGTKNVYKYCNDDYALMRVLIPYVVDGPSTYKPFESLFGANAGATAMAYRHYVRGRILSRAGLPSADDYYVGPAPATIYFDKSASPKPIPDNVNIPGKVYDETSDSMVLRAGSGNWTLSAEEYSQFISALWRGKIVSDAMLEEMLPTQAGFYGFAVASNPPTLRDGYQPIDLWHNGGGGSGGPSAIWVQFFNGYTAVLTSNTAWGLVASDIATMEKSLDRATLPTAWSCFKEYYGTKDGCDCACGAWDPDCDDTSETVYGCSVAKPLCVYDGSVDHGVCVASNQRF